jgi:hypothetical protein
VNNASNSISGTSEIKAGRIVMGANTALGTGTVLLNGGTLERNAAGQTVANPITVGASGGTIVGRTTVDDYTTFSGALSGSGALTTQGLVSLSNATGGFTGCAVTGDLVLGMARNGGAIGFVTDGCVRDLPGIAAVGIPAFCVGVTPNSPARSGPGTVGFPVVLAGMRIASGDVLLADGDGVVVIPQERIEEVLAKLPAIRSAEADMERRVAAGMRTPPFLDPA